MQSCLRKKWLARLATDRQILYLAAEKLGSSDLDMDTILDMSYKMPDNSMGSFMEGVNSLGYEFDSFAITKCTVSRQKSSAGSRRKRALYFWEGAQMWY